MPGLSMKETSRLLEHIEPQGVGITKIKNGVMLRLPNGDSTVVHYSVSDHRGPQKLKATLKRAGVSWPTDPHRPQEVKGLPTKRAQEVGHQAITALGKPARVKPAQMRAQFAELGWPEVTNGTIRRVMMWLGYEATGHTNSLTWVKPSAAKNLRALDAMTRTAAEPAPIVSIIPEPIEDRRDEVPGAAPEPEPEPDVEADVEAELDAPDVHTTADGREFIDSHDSWTLELSDTIRQMSVDQLAAVMDATGLGVEIRVWKR